jgi:branched-chain amino acid transport system substrate-binding protein
LFDLPVNAKEVRGITNDAIKIGVSTDMTGPVVSILGQMTEGYRNFFRHINDKGGINGRKVEVVVEDDRYSIPLCVANFKRLLYKEKVFVFIPSGTGQTKALYRNIEKEKIPTFTVSLAEDMVIPYRRYIFIPSATYEDQITLMFKYIKEVLGVKQPKISYVSPDSEYGKTGFRAATSTAEKYGLKLASTEVLALGAFDASTQAMSLKRIKPDFVILVEDLNSAVAILRDARKLSLETSFFGNYYTCDDDIVQLGGKASESYLGVQSFSSWHDDIPGMKTVRNITLKYYPNIKSRNRYYMQGWVTAMIITEGLKKAGKNLDTESFLTSLESIKNLDSGGVTGLISYSPKLHKATEYLKIFKPDTAKNRLIPITDWMKP